MTTLKIPAHLPAYTCAWLAYLDGECRRRADLTPDTTPLDHANALIVYGRGELFHFATLYAQLLKE